MPKSVTLARPSGSIRTFCGFTSRGAGRWAGLVQGGGEAQVGDSGPAVGAGKAVGRVYVRGAGPVGVGGQEGAADLDRVGNRLRDRQRTLAPDQLLERLAVDVLEDDK